MGDWEVLKFLGREAAFNGGEPRLACHQHAGAAAVRLVVYLAPAAPAELAQVDDVDAAQPLFHGARDD